MISLFADDEKSDSVIRVDLIEGVDVRSDILEDKHYVISSIQVKFLVFFKSCLYLLLFLCLLPHFLKINNRLLLLNLFDRLDCLLLVCISFSIDQILVDLYLPLIKISIIIDSQLRSKAIDNLFRLLDQRMIVNLLPTDPFLGVYCKAPIDKITSLI